MARQPYLILDPQDPVAIATRDLPAGTRLVDGDAAIVLADDVPLGSKFARRAIAAGERIVKYGAPIGSATQAIAPGALVHTHNMQSDYLPTFELRGAARAGGGVA